MIEKIKEIIKKITLEIKQYLAYNRRERNKKRAVKNIIGRVTKTFDIDEKYKGEY